METKQAAKAGRYEPAWHAKFRQLYASNSAFILHGNVQDYVVPGMRLPAYLAESMKLREFGLVVFYDRARGITFATPQMEAKARKILGLEAPKPGDAPKGGDLDIAAILGNVGQASDKPPEFPKSLSGALPLLEALMRSDPDLYYPSRRKASDLAPYEARQIEKDETTGQKTAVILCFGEHIAPSQDVGAMAPEDRVAQIILRQWGTDPMITRRGSVAFFLADMLSDVSMPLRNSWRALKVPLPDITERREFVKAFVDGWDTKLESGMSLDELATITAGLDRTSIEAIWQQADSEYQSALEDIRAADPALTDKAAIAKAPASFTRELVKRMKDDIIRSRYSGMIELIEPTYGFDKVGGQEGFKAAAAEVIKAVREGRFRDVPKGWLLVGPPGTGKTYCAHAFAFECRWQVGGLHMSKVYSKWQGESERTMEQILDLAYTLSPMLLFVDEFDQVEGVNRDQVGGSPSGKNILNQLLQFMGRPDIRGKVMVLAASNRPDLIDSALRRNERFDALIPFMLPERDERLMVAQKQCAMQEIGFVTGALELMADQSEGYSAADVAALVHKARKVARRNGRDKISREDAQFAVDMIRPATVAEATRFERIALDTCSDLEFLPAKYRAKVDAERRRGAEIYAEAEPAATARRRALD